MNGRKKDQESHMLVEADIGSGEKTPGQEDTEKIIEQIGLPAPDESGRPDRRQAASGGAKKEGKAGS